MLVLPSACTLTATILTRTRSLEMLRSVLCESFVQEILYDCLALLVIVNILLHVKCRGSPLLGDHLAVSRSVEREVQSVLSLSLSLYPVSFEHVFLN